MILPLTRTQKMKVFFTLSFFENILNYYFCYDICSNFVFQERLESKKIMDHALKWIYISCKIQHTENSILYEMIKQVDPETKIPMKGFSLDYYYSVLLKVIKENSVYLVVILD